MSICNVVHFDFVYRWLHAYCDQFTKEEDVERAADAGYKCYFCRPKSHSFFSITSTSTMTTASRWSQSVNTLSCVSSYAFGTFGRCIYENYYGSLKLYFRYLGSSAIGQKPVGKIRPCKNVEFNKLNYTKLNLNTVGTYSCVVNITHKNSSVLMYIPYLRF